MYQKKSPGKELKHSVLKIVPIFHCLKKIVLVISKILQILDIQPQVSKGFLNYLLEQFFLTVGQNNFGNKIPLLYRQIENRENSTAQCKWVSIGANRISKVFVSYLYNLKNLLEHSFSLVFDICSLMLTQWKSPILFHNACMLYFFRFLDKN